MIDDCTAIILAGGQSRRMGQDKALLSLAGLPLLQHSIGQLEPIFAQLIISVRQQMLDIPYTQVMDVDAQQGPMMGIASAMQRVNTAWVFVVACDMPFVSPTLLQAMADKRDQHQAVVPVVQGFAQPLFAFYRSDCLALFQAALQQGKRSLKAALKTIDTYNFSEIACQQHDAQLHSFFDLDTPQDVVLAEDMLQQC